MAQKSERFELRLDQEFSGRIDAWRSSQPSLPSRAEAVRQLVDAGLRASTDKQLFAIAKFQILSAGFTKGPDAYLHDAYLFAWDRGVYPLFHQGADWHLPFRDDFPITCKMMEDLSEFLDARWMKKKVPTFYELEDEFLKMRNDRRWDRGRLIYACRYMFLNELFDSNFWKVLLTASRHPSEAGSLTRKFERKNDIYLL